MLQNAIKSCLGIDFELKGIKLNWFIFTGFASAADLKTVIGILASGTNKSGRSGELPFRSALPTFLGAMGSAAS